MWTCMCAKSLQWCPTLCDPIEHGPAGSSVHGILQARVLEWVAMPSSRGSSRPRDRTCASWVSCIGSWLLHHQCHLGTSMCMCMYDFKRNSYIIFQSDFTSIPKGNVDNSSCSILCHHLGFISCKILSHYSRCVVILNSRLFTFGNTGSLLLPVSSVQSLSHVWLFTTPSIAARQASLSITNSLSWLTLNPIESVTQSSHLILCRPLLLLPPIPPSIRVFFKESTFRMRWPKYWSFSFSISPSSERPGLISFRMDWLDLLAVQGTLKSLLQHQILGLKSIHQG